MLWGVATAAYQVEGGLNGPDEPANNWAGWDRSGRVERCGEALGFWGEPDVLLDRAAALGCNAFRFSVEWARVQPSPHRHVTLEPSWDAAALDRYADIIVGCRRRGMEPVVTLVHFTHPWWCGEDFWLRGDAPSRVEAYARRCVSELGRRVVERGTDPVRWWITLNEPAVVPVTAHLLGIFPSVRRGIRAVGAAFEHAIAAHVRAYDAVHDVHEREGWERPLVSTNAISWTAVDLDAAVVDLLLARERGVTRDELGRHLTRCRSRARRRVAAVPRRGPVAALVDAAVHAATRLVALEPGGPAADALYRSPRPRKLDYLSLDYYDPVIGNFFRPRLGPTPFGAELWEQEVAPDGLAVFLRQAHLQAPDRPILVAENGLATPDDGSRPDGVRRDDFLRAMVGEVLRARDEGLPIAGYLHWTLADNYEWGSYRPRFGLYGVDRRHGVRILETDAGGVDAAGTFRSLVTADRS